MAKHIIVLKCDGNCPYNGRSYWKGDRRACRCPIEVNGKLYQLGKTIPKGDFKGKLFPEFCPLQDYEVERCDKIQLKKKKMQDHIKRRKRCRN